MGVFAPARILQREKNNDCMKEKRLGFSKSLLWGFTCKLLCFFLVCVQKKFCFVVIQTQWFFVVLWHKVSDQCKEEFYHQYEDRFPGSKRSLCTCCMKFLTMPLLLSRKTHSFSDQTSWLALVFLWEKQLLISAIERYNSQGETTSLHIESDSWCLDDYGILCMKSLDKY